MQKQCNSINRLLTKMLLIEVISGLSMSLKVTAIHEANTLSTQWLPVRLTRHTKSGPCDAICITRRPYPCAAAAANNRRCVSIYRNRLLRDITNNANKSFTADHHTYSLWRLLSAENSLDFITICRPTSVQHMVGSRLINLYHADKTEK